MKVRDIGEQGLLERLQSFCPLEIIGDDAAVLAATPGELLVVTTDMLVDGVHFSDRTTSPVDAGWRAAAANLSDLAAMGASPIGITVALSLPGDLSVSWVEQLYQGLTACLQHYDTSIVGGDICRAPTIAVAITAFGRVSPTHVIRRSSARVGDAIVITGVHGAARAGLELLLNPELGQNLSESERNFLIQAHQRPKPRLDVLPLLWELNETRESGESFQLNTQHSTLHTSYDTPHFRLAGMDSSDGLADAVIQICRSSGVGASLQRNSIPISSALNKLVSPEQALNWTLYGGEDFELVLCLPEKTAQIFVKELGSESTIIGTIDNREGAWLVDDRGVYPDDRLTLDRGFQHFALTPP
ncbi:MAG: thiamine-phosphate kinase [Cyanosarcina radialis HA8281-LM2]|jgi:thiamine-monophosphate kinase|nr:thiamine-phosphate kinase [Cyanosarcina radialis HA8281-LM2]